MNRSTRRDEDLTASGIDGGLWNEDAARLLFIRGLCQLSAADIRQLATRMESRLITPADEVAWWQANLAIERMTRTATPTRAQRITAAGVRASRCVHDVAERLGLPLPDTAVTRVARAAGQVARGLALGASAREHVDYLLDAWRLAPMPATSPADAPGPHEPIGSTLSGRIPASVG